MRSAPAISTAWRMWDRRSAGRDETGDDLAGVKRHMRARVDRAQVLDHLHLQRVVAQRDGIVLGLDEVDADVAGIAELQLETEQEVREDELGARRTAHLVVVADLHRACRVRSARAAAQLLLVAREVGVGLGDSGRDDRRHAAIQELLAERGEAPVEPHAPGEAAHLVALPRDERLEVEDVLPGIDLRDLGQHVALPGRRRGRAGREAELAERREEVVMAALSARLEALHRPRPHDLREERPIRIRVSGGTLTGGARPTGHRGRRHRRQRRRVDAQTVTDRVGDEGLRRHGP